MSPRRTLVLGAFCFNWQSSLQMDRRARGCEFDYCIYFGRLQLMLRNPRVVPGDPRCYAIVATRCRHLVVAGPDESHVHLGQRGVRSSSIARRHPAGKQPQPRSDCR